MKHVLNRNVKVDGLIWKTGDEYVGKSLELLVKLGYVDAVGEPELKPVEDQAISELKEVAPELKEKKPKKRKKAEDGLRDGSSSTE